jgi:hypothetical protein
MGAGTARSRKWHRTTAFRRAKPWRIAAPTVAGTAVRPLPAAPLYEIVAFDQLASRQAQALVS